MNILIEREVDKVIEHYKAFSFEQFLDDKKDNSHKFAYATSKRNDYVKGRLNSVARIRLDWEVVDNLPYETAIDLFRTVLVDDLLDMTENGDIEHCSDPILKVIDGSKKRGKEPKDIEIVMAQFVVDKSKRKATHEFTAYMVISYDW